MHEVFLQDFVSHLQMPIQKSLCIILSKLSTALGLRFFRFAVLGVRLNDSILLITSVDYASRRQALAKHYRVMRGISYHQ